MRETDVSGPSVCQLPGAKLSAEVIERDGECLAELLRMVEVRLGDLAAVNGDSGPLATPNVGTLPRVADHFDLPGEPCLLCELSVDGLERGFTLVDQAAWKFVQYAARSRSELTGEDDLLIRCESQHRNRVPSRHDVPVDFCAVGHAVGLRDNSDPTGGSGTLTDQMPRLGFRHSSPFRGCHRGNTINFTGGFRVEY